MSEITNNGNNFVGFEYKDVSVNKTKQSVYADSYSNFGWILEENSVPVGKPDFRTKRKNIPTDFTGSIGTDTSIFPGI